MQYTYKSAPLAGQDSIAHSISALCTVDARVTPRHSIQPRLRAAGGFGGIARDGHALAFRRWPQGVEPRIESVDDLVFKDIGLWPRWQGGWVPLWPALAQRFEGEA